MCCRVLQCVAVCCSALQCVAVCCSALQCVAVRCSVLHAVYCSALLWVAVRCSVLQCVAVCCSALQCVAVCCSVSGLKTPQPETECTKERSIHTHRRSTQDCNTLQHTATHCNAVLQCVAVCCRHSNLTSVAIHSK